MANFSELHDSTTVLLASSRQTLEADTSGFQGFDVNFDDNTLNMFRVIGFCIALIWGLYALFQFSKPENKGGGIMQRIGGIAPMVVAFVAIVCMVDMNKTIDVLNLLIKGARAIVNMFTSGMDA